MDNVTCTPKGIGRWVVRFIDRNDGRRRSFTVNGTNIGDALAAAVTRYEREHYDAPDGGWML